MVSGSLSIPATLDQYETATPTSNNPDITAEVENLLDTPHDIITEDTVMTVAIPGTLRDI
jgi:hypothetical protein